MEKNTIYIDVRGEGLPTPRGTTTAVATSKNLSLAATQKRTPNIGFQYRLSLNTGQKYCRMLQGEYSATLSTFIKLPFSINCFVA